MSRALFSHPDGYRLSFAHGELVAMDDNDNEVRIPIGPIDIAQLSAQLADLAVEADDIGHEEGHDIANWCLEEMHGMDSASRASTIEHALFDLQHRTTHPAQARAGFALVMESEIGQGVPA